MSRDRYNLFHTMNPRPFLPLILSAFCAISASARDEVRYNTAAEQCLQAELNEPLTDDAIIRSLRDSWLEDIRRSREPGQNHDIEALSSTEMEAVLLTVEYYTEAARAAYEAQMAFARHSLSIVQQEAPELYATTLNRYRCALQHLYRRDLQILRAASPLVANHPSGCVVETDDFIEAINHRANISVWGGAASRGFEGTASDIAWQQLEIKRKYITALISRESDIIYLAPELLSNHSPSQKRPENYDATALDMFMAAEEAWEAYSWRAANLLCPGGMGEGQGSGICKMYLRMELMKNHEKYYALLLMGFAQ